MNAVTIACDFDGTLWDQDRPLSPGLDTVPFPGAVEALKKLHAAGARLILWSCRCNPYDDSPLLLDEEQRFWSYGEIPIRVKEQWDSFSQMRRILKTAGVWDLFQVWQSPGKPLADFYIDAKAERPDWPGLVKQFTMPEGSIT